MLKKYIIPILKNRLMKNIIGNYLLKAIAMILSYVSMPVYMNYFSSNKLLGVWFTLTSVINWIMMFDFGIGAGVRNNLVVAYSNNDKKEISKILSSGFAANTIVVILMCILQHFVVEIINWNNFLGLSNGDISENDIKIIIHILCIGVAIRLYISFMANVYYSLQKALASSIMSVCTNFLILIFMLFKPQDTNIESIIALAVAHAVFYNLPGIIAFIDLIFNRFKNIRLRIRNIDGFHMKMVIGAGLGFFGLQILITLAFGAKELMITWFIDADSVVQYNVYQKIIGFVSTLFSLALVSVWSEVTEMFVNNKSEELKKLYLKGMKMVMLIGLGQVILIVLFPWINSIWLGENAVDFTMSSLIIYAVYNVIYMVIMLNYNFLCGMSKVKVLTISLLFMVGASFFLSFIGSLRIHHWIVVIIATIIASIPTIIFTSIDVIKKIKRCVYT